MIELPAICGKHVVYYPAVLATAGMHGQSHAFITSCECGTAYLIETRPDGAHCKLAGDPLVVAERYKTLPHDEIVIKADGRSFRCKLLPSAAS